MAQILPLPSAAPTCDPSTTVSDWAIADPKKIHTETLRGNDRFMYANTSKLNPMLMMGLMFVDHVPPHNALRAIVLEMVTNNRRMRSIISKDKKNTKEKWVECSSIVLDDHLEYATNESNQSVVEIVNGMVNTTIDSSKPLFKICIIQDESCANPRERVGIFFRIHHVIGDGMSCVHLLESFLEYRDQKEGDVPPQLVHIPRHPRKITTVMMWLFSMWGVLGSMLSVRTDPYNCLHPRRGKKGQGGSRVSSTRQGLAEPKIFLYTHIDMKRIKAIAEKHGHTVTTVLIAVIAGAFRRFLQLNEDKVNRDLHAIIPISTRPKNPLEDLGNNVLSAFVHLPVSQASPARRLRRCANQLEDLKAGPHFALSKLLLMFISAIPLSLSKYLQERYANKVTVIISSIPGPKEALQIAKSEIQGIFAVPPTIGRMAISLATFSYVDSIGVGMLANKNIPHVDKLPALFSDELEALEKDFECTRKRTFDSNTINTCLCLILTALVVVAVLFIPQLME